LSTKGSIFRCGGASHILRRINMVLEKVKAILSEQFDVEEDSITSDTNIADDLGADSLDVVDLLMSIEDEFEIEIPDEEVENLKTVGELVKYIEDHQ
jgi:acyl carrier protein